MNVVGAKVLFGVSVMADHLKQVAQLCPSVEKIILMGPNQEGCVSYQEMMQDAGDLFNDNLDVRLKYKPFIKEIPLINCLIIDRYQ